MPLFSKNVNLGAPLRVSSWRKIAIGSWRTAGDPSVYGVIELDVEPALEYLARINATSAAKTTLSHFVGKVVADTLALHPDLNCVLRFGKLYPRTDVDIFFQVATDAQGQDLSGVTVRQADKKSIIEIATELKSEVKQVRHAGDPRFKQTKKTMQLIPGFMVSTILNLLGFILYSLNIWSPIFGAPKDAFGSCMITNIGTLGLGLALAPLIPYSRVPFLLSVGSVMDKPIVKDGQVRAGKVMQIGVTVDHRLIDGLRASFMAKYLQAYFANPSGAFDKTGSHLPEKTKGIVFEPS